MVARRIEARLCQQPRGPFADRRVRRARSLGEVPVYNTLGTIKGSEKPNEYILLSAHFDSWDGSQGATDNGTGTITMMEAMRILKLAYPNPKRTIMVGHWPGEEQGLNGSHAYAYDHPEIVRAIQAGFNQDNGTGRIQSTSGVGLPNGGEHMQQWLSKLPSELQSQIRYNGVGAPATGGTAQAVQSRVSPPLPLSSPRSVSDAVPAAAWRVGAVGIPGGLSMTITSSSS